MTNPEAERSLINTAIISEDNHVISEAESLGINSEVFGIVEHADIWSMISTMHKVGEKVTDGELIHRFNRNFDEKASQRLQNALFDILESPDPISRWSDRADDILEAYKHRQLHRVALEIKDKVAEKEPAQEIASFTETKVREISELGYYEASLADAAKALYQDLFVDVDMSKYIPTGLTDYDKSLKRRGFGPKQLVTLGARPGMGKTTFALNVALHCAKNVKKHALIFSLEMDAQELLAKLVSTESGMSLRHFEDGVASPSQISKFQKTLKNISKMPFIIKDDAYQLNLITSIARNTCRRKDVGIIIIDYCQLIKVADQRKPREQQIAEISRELKLLAKSLEVPIMLLCQLNRESEKEDRPPRMSDLRESGAIEQDSDSITFLYRLKEDEEQPEVIRWIRPKQRAGESPKDGKLIFKKEIGLFVSDYV